MRVYASPRGRLGPRWSAKLASRNGNAPPRARERPRVVATSKTIAGRTRIESIHVGERPFGAGSRRHRSFCLGLGERGPLLHDDALPD
jgi:hypothetical protein